MMKLAQVLVGGRYLGPIGRAKHGEDVLKTQDAKALYKDKVRVFELFIGRITCKTVLE